MGRKLVLVTLFLFLILLSISYSNDKEVETQVLDMIEHHDEVGVIVKLEKPVEELSFIEKTQASNIEFEHLGGDQYVAKVNEAELQELLQDPNVLSIEEDEIFDGLLPIIKL